MRRSEHFFVVASVYETRKNSLGFNSGEAM
jgi:hypothetical protein